MIDDLTLLESEKEYWFKRANQETNYGWYSEKLRCSAKWNKDRFCSHLKDHEGPHVSGLVSLDTHIIIWYSV